jgi:protein tyrosine/serine phosphatase
LVEAIRVTAGPNWHEVDSGVLYRSAQLTGPELNSVIHRFGIRSIINLRGACPDESWYWEEKSVAQQFSVTHHDLNFCPYSSPAPQELQKLLQALESSPRPILVHCRRGADRTGLASMLAYLYFHDSEIVTAQQQFSLRYGHFGLGKVSVLHKVVNEYLDWLNYRGQTHTRERLRQWVFEAYKPIN